MTSTSLGTKEDYEPSNRDKGGQRNEKDPKTKHDGRISGGVSKYEECAKKERREKKVKEGRRGPGDHHLVVSKTSLRHPLIH